MHKLTTRVEESHPVNLESYLARVCILAPFELEALVRWRGTLDTQARFEIRLGQRTVKPLDAGTQAVSDSPIKD